MKKSLYRTMGEAALKPTLQEAIDTVHGWFSPGFASTEVLSTVVEEWKLEHPDQCDHKRLATTALGAVTNTGWKCKDCGTMISETGAPDQVKLKKFACIAFAENGDQLFQPAGRAVEYAPTVFDALLKSMEAEVESIDNLRVYAVSMDKPEDWPILYRAHGSVRDYGSGPDSSIWFASYAIVGYTPQGVWIDQGVQKPKFVNLKCDRKWAALTKREALYGYYRRKIIQVRILSSNIMCAETSRDHVKRILDQEM